MKTHRSFKTGSKTIRYTYDGHLRSAEQQAIDKFIGMAYNMSMHAIKQFEKQTAESVNFFKMIYGKDADAPGKIVESYKSIIQHIERGLKIRREKVFISGDGESVHTVLSGADLKEDIVIIYDAFFKEAEGDELGLNARSSVILHEIAHLIGLGGDEEQDSLDSAECLRNLTLLVCEIAKPEDLFAGDEDENDENAKLKSENGELPHNPNHLPAGTPQGGQFAPKEGGGNNGSGSGEPSKKENTEKPESPKSEPGSKAPEKKVDNSTVKVPKTPEDLAENRKDIENILKEASEIPVDYSMNEDSFSVDPNNGPEGEDYLIWGTTDIKIDKLESNTDYTIWMQGKYQYKDKKTGETKTETAEWAYQVKSNEKGEIDMERVGIINQDRANDVQNYKGGELDININIAPIKGTVEENFGEPDKVGWNPYKDTGGQTPNTYETDTKNPNFIRHSEYGLGSYGANHAQVHSDGNKGGGVNGRIPRNKPAGKSSIGFKVDSDKGTVKASRQTKKSETSNKMKKSGQVLKRI